MSFWVYLLECKDGYIYTGITWNLTKRIKEHEQGLTPFTKNRLPVKLIYKESFDSRIHAAKREKEIKGWNRNKKLLLVKVYAESVARRVYAEELSDEAGSSSVG